MSKKTNHTVPVVLGCLLGAAGIVSLLSVCDRRYRTVSVTILNTQIISRSEFRIVPTVTVQSKNSKIHTLACKDFLVYSNLADGCGERYKLILSPYSRDGMPCIVAAVPDGKAD